MCFVPVLFDVLKNGLSRSNSIQKLNVGAQIFCGGLSLS
jgi:hypothetical protein